jgi:hypothetical protein
MASSYKAVLVGLLALTLATGPALGYDPKSVEQDQEQSQRQPTSGEMFLDAVVGRPLGLFAMVLGTAAFVISLPFTLPSHSADEAAKTLVNVPTRFTFKRPLGRFASCEDQPELCQ